MDRLEAFNNHPKNTFGIRVMDSPTARLIFYDINDPYKYMSLYDFLYAVVDNGNDEEIDAVIYLADVLIDPDYKPYWFYRDLIQLHQHYWKQKRRKAKK